MRSRSQCSSALTSLQPLILSVTRHCCSGCSRSLVCLELRCRRSGRTWQTASSLSSSVCASRPRPSWKSAYRRVQYQILYLDRIMILAWHHLVNDTDLCRSPKSPKKIHKTPILAFKVIRGHWIRWQSTASVRLHISD